MAKGDEVRAEERAQVEELFEAALPLSADARKRFLGGAQSGVRAEVRSLLAAQTATGSTGIAAAIVDAAAEAAELVPGSVFAHFEIVRLLGRGGMGEVYLVVDLSLGRQVALKLLPTAFQQDPERLRRFIREARAAATLNHPHIVTVYEVGESHGQPFIATEFVEGENLADMLVRGSIALSEGIRLGRQIVIALAAARTAGIVHRDLKPAQHLPDHGRHREACRFRVGSPRPWFCGEGSLHERWSDPRHAGIHGSRAAGGAASRRPN
jgi:hypothetical protein